MALKILLLTVLACFCNSLWSQNHITIPPKGWECIQDPQQLPLKIKELYIGKGPSEKNFAPSLNVAKETTPLPLPEYVDLAKTYHEGQAGTRCTKLKKIKTLAGEAELIQIDRPSRWGPVRFLQAILLKDGEAYVVTATCLKEDFGTLSTQLIKAIQSFSM